MNAMCCILAAASILTATATAATAQTHSELLEKAIFTEETIGDLEGAARLYEQLVGTPSVSREIVAEARGRLADSRRRQADRQRALAAPPQAGAVIAFRPGSLAQSNADAVAAAGVHDHDNECCGTFTLNYDPTRMVTVSGSVKAMEWLNPMVILTVAGTDGSNWGFTLPPPNRLIRGGLTRTSFKPGEEVVVTGYLATGRDSNCPVMQPSACSTLPGGALHASASVIVSADGRTLFDRKAPPPAPLDLQQLGVPQPSPQASRVR